MDPDDARSKRIALTQRGVSLGRTIRAAVIEVEGEWAARLGVERFEQLRKLLHELAELDQTP